MSTEKIKKWIYNLKRLPNTKRGLASGACSAIAMITALTVYVISEILGHKWSTTWFIILVIGAEGVATIAFVTWSKAALRLNENEPIKPENKTYEDNA